MPDTETPRKAEKKASKSFIAAAASSRFKRRQASESSTSATRGWSAAKPLADSGSTGGTSLRSNTHYDQGSTSYSSSASRPGLVRPIHSLHISPDIVESINEGAGTVNKLLDTTQDFVQSPGPIVPRRSTPDEVLYDNSGSPARPATPNSNKSRAHWNLLRSAILPGPPPTSPPTASRSSPIPPPPPRSQSPRPSRFARLGFRQVVDQVHEVVHGHSSKFEIDIYEACVSTRFGRHRQKTDREGSHASLIPSTSLPLALSLPSQSGKLGMAQNNDVTGQIPWSLKVLHQTLIGYASLFGPAVPDASLPYEVEVFSALLVPFTEDFGKNAEDERFLAVEAYDVAVKTWRASSPQREIDRVLWCCKAALIPASPVRSRVLGSLANMMFSSKPFQKGTPLGFQSVLQGLLLLLHTFNKNPQHSRADTEVVRELLERATSGACGELDQQEVETEYEALWGIQDNEATVRNHIIAEGVVRGMENGSDSFRLWILHEPVEAHWPPQSDSVTPLCRKIIARRLSAFFRVSLSLLSTESQVSYRSQDLTTIIRILHRSVPELAQLPLSKHSNDSRALAVELAVELLSFESHAQRQQVVDVFRRWCEDPDTRQNLETGLHLFIQQAEWLRLAKSLQNVVDDLPESLRNSLIANMLSALHTRLIINPAPHPLSELTSLLRSLSRLNPQLFYKPLFSLAGASKDQTLIRQLEIVTALARHLPEFWVSDSEMLSVALMSDIGSTTGKETAKEGTQAGWGKARIGQSLIMVELLRRMKQLAAKKEDPLWPPGTSQSNEYRFVTGLEARLAILLDAKEQKALVPFSQRVLFSILFLEIRLFTRSLKQAPWLQKIVTWTAQSALGTDSRVGDDVLDEVLSTVSKIKSIYIACWRAPLSNNRHRSTIFDPNLSTIDSQGFNSEAAKDREELMASLPSSVASATLPLLVAVCPLLTQQEHSALAPVLWSRFLDEENPKIVAPTCFLLTHGFESASTIVRNVVENDMNGSDGNMRLAVVRRLMTLYSWRSQLLSQKYLHDRTRRRPFRVAQQPLEFVPIDAGSGNYVHEQTEEERKNLPGGTLPQDIRKRLAEFGWEQGDRLTDTRLERLKTPMSLLPLSHFKSFNSPTEKDDTSAARSTESVNRVFRRRSSSSSYHSVTQRRPVLVPALVSMLSSLSTLAIDSESAVASAAREAILLMLRDDPSMLCRPAMDYLTVDPMRVGNAVSIIHAFLHIHHRLPPSASHHLFSYLGGFIKHVSRDSDNPEAFRAFSYTVPVLAKLVDQVSSLSVRDLRRAKFEIYVFPSGSLWFPPTAPLSAMLPQSIGPLVNPFDEFPDRLIGILMIRTAQNMLALNMLKRKPQEAHTIRKSLNTIELPGQIITNSLDVLSFVPQRPINGITQAQDYKRISLAFSRSYILLLGQVFRNMSRNFNDRIELARLFDGLNRILLKHGDDIGIVAHALIVCMVAVTRFKRLVSSHRGFALFMPCLLKVFTECEGNRGIRQAIQYASSRFYAIHEEAYVFQSLDLAAYMLVHVKTSEDRDWFARSVYVLFAALHILNTNAPDAAGIRGQNMVEEQDSLIATAVSDDYRSPGHQDSPRGEQLKKVLTAGQYESIVLNLDDLVRLLLTVIAHDPTILRAQNILALLRHMAPHFYNGSNSSRVVLRDGINALSSALFAKGPRQKMQENILGRPSPQSNNATDFYDPASPCDPMLIRREYLGLVLAYNRIGGELRPEVIRRALDIVKSQLKESTSVHPESEGIFLHEFTESSLLRLSVSPKQAAGLLSGIAPIIKAFPLSIDTGRILDTIGGLLKRSEFVNDDFFMQLVITQIAGPILDACREAALDNTLLSLPMRPAVVTFIAQAIASGNLEIISYIEMQTPSPGFLAGIVLPLCMTMKTSTESTPEERRYLDRPVKSGFVFLRLLVYAMEACHSAGDQGDSGKTLSIPGISRRDSQRSKGSSVSVNRAQLAIPVLVIQIIKIIVLRAGEGLSSGLGSIWVRLARFLQELLDEGDARFALHSEYSRASSPSQSPQQGPQPHTPSSERHVFSPTGSAPRVVDYLAWSFLEYLCRVPSPLNLHLRLWMREKVHHLDSELKNQNVSTPSLGTRSRRNSASVFARRRGSSVSSDALHPSYNLTTSIPSGDLNISVSSSTDLHIQSRFSTRASLQPSWNGPRIVHLGPTKDTQQLFPPGDGTSQDSNLRSLARSVYIESSSLIGATYNCIRLVQMHMGYDRLLTTHGHESDINNITPKVWSVSSAVKAVLAETKELMNEFPEVFQDTIGGDFIESNSGHDSHSATVSPMKLHP